MTGRRVSLTVLALLAVAAGSALSPQLRSGGKEYLRALMIAAGGAGGGWPRPTGPFPVGTTSVTAGTGSPGRIDVWYPAEAEATAWRDRGARLLGRLLHPGRAQGLEQADPRPGRHPLVLYLPSWFSTRDENTFTLANLASHGFVVAAVDDFVHGVPLSGADRAAQVAALDFASETAFAASRALSRRRVVLGARAAEAAIDAVLADPRFGPRIDGERIGVLGFSFGGSIAAAMARDRRIRAAINLDGDVVEPELWPPAVPYLFLTSDLPYPSAADLASRDRAFRFESLTTRDTYDLHLRPDMPRHSIAFSVRGTVHQDFSDRLIMPALHDLWQRRSIDRLRTWSEIDGVLVAFLDAHLKPGASGRITVPDGDFRSLPGP